MIYTITLFSSEKDYGRCIGFFDRVENASKAVEQNIGNMSENGFYSLVLIEEVSEGLYPNTKEIQWYRWSTEDIEGYKPISKPEAFKHFSNFAVG